MTIHANYNNKCIECGNPYIKYNEKLSCPNCGHFDESATTIDFIDLAVQSIEYNGGVMPLAFGVFSFGDHVLYTLFEIFVRFNRVQGEDFRLFLETLLVDLDDDFWKKHLTDISVLVHDKLYNTQTQPKGY